MGVCRQRFRALEETPTTLVSTKVTVSKCSVSLSCLSSSTGHFSKHSRNRFMTKITCCQGVHSQGDTQADNGQENIMASELSPKLAAGEGGLHTHRGCLSRCQCWGLPCSSAGDARRAMAAFRVRPMSIQVTDEDRLFRAHFNKETQ